MADKKPANTMNVYQKLAAARLAFLNENVKKSGKNIKLEFMYFELADIIPSATRIFADLGLVSRTNITEASAEMIIINADNVDDPNIIFTAPYREAGQIISRDGKAVTNPLQALGASITYLRRYLYMMALDIVEQDEVDGQLTKPKEDKQAAPKRPATVEERKEAKAKLTAVQDGNASAEQLATLKALLKAVLDADPNQEEFVQNIAMRTEGLTVISADACAKLIENLEAMKNEVEQ